jgi:membrane protease YdiL (CAAX protease family)
MPPWAPSRKARAVAAERTLLALGVFAAWFALMGLIGLGVGLAMVVLMALGRVRARVVSRDCGGPFGTVYLETFVIWMLVFFGGQVLLSVLSAEVGMLGPAALFIASLGALGWPVLRGLAPGQVAEDVGLRWGRWWTSPLAGLGTYALGLPLIVCGLLLAVVVAQLLPGAAPPEHPIQEEIASAGLGGVLALVVLAAVIVPPVEEIFFRGVLYRHLRELWGRCGSAVAVVLSIGLSSLLFAALHPQGVTFIPVLGALAVAFAISREVTGSIWPATIAHGLSNGVVVALNAVLFAS